MNFSRVLRLGLRENIAVDTMQPEWGNRPTQWDERGVWGILRRNVGKRLLGRSKEVYPFWSSSPGQVRRRHQRPSQLSVSAEARLTGFSARFREEVT